MKPRLNKQLVPKYLRFETEQMLLDILVECIFCVPQKRYFDGQHKDRQLMFGDIFVMQVETSSVLFGSQYYFRSIGRQIIENTVDAPNIKFVKIIYEVNVLFSGRIP